MSVPSFLLAPSSFNSATTATGSVALITAPNISAIFHSQLNKPIFVTFNNIAKPPLNIKAKIIPGTARITELVTVFLKVCKSIA